MSLIKTWMHFKSEVDMNHIIIDAVNILKRLSKLNVFKSSGPDMLHPRLLKEVRNEIAIALKLIFDCFLASDELPRDWRSGYIIPIYNKGKGSKCLPNNYRPVSLTCIVLPAKFWNQLFVIKLLNMYYIITY